MLKTVEIEIDEDLVQEVIRRHLALRALLGETEDGELDHHEEEYDEFSDPKAWQPAPKHRHWVTTARHRPLVPPASSSLEQLPRVIACGLVALRARL